VKKQNIWTKAVTPQIKSNMQESAHAAYANGCALLEDALFLVTADRYPRATALAILAEEEFSKAFILLVSAMNGRWDSNIFLSLRKHSNKQGISEAMLDYLDWFKQNYQWVMEINRYTLVQAQPDIHPGDEKMEQLYAKAKSRFAKPIRDYLKQDAFYVSIDEDGKPKSIPNSIGKEDALRYLKDSEKFQVVVEMLLGDPNAAKKYAWF